VTAVRLPLWRIYGDLFSAWALLGIAPGAADLLSSEDHRFLAERYAQLAARWRRIGWRTHAVTLEAKADRHVDAAGDGDLPPAVAVALPRPRPFVSVDARCRVLGGRWTRPPTSSRSLPTPR
jgi:hypothetical protein